MHFFLFFLIFAFQILLVIISLQCVRDGVYETGISFLFQFYMLVFVNLCISGVPMIERTRKSIDF